MSTIHLKIHQKLVLNNSTQTLDVDISDSNELLLRVCRIMSATNTFKRYYPYSTSLMLNGYLPYIKRDQEYIWEVPITEVTLQEFIDTFPNCLEEGIYIETMIPAAGGKDYLKGRIAWDVIKLFITTVIPGSNLTVGIADIVLETTNLLKKSNVSNHLTPPEYISFMYQQFKEVGEREVAELLGIEIYEAATILKNLGYKKYEGSERYYLPSENRDKVLVLASMINNFEEAYAEKLVSGSTEYNL